MMRAGWVYPTGSKLQEAAAMNTEKAKTETLAEVLRELADMFTEFEETRIWLGKGWHAVNDGDPVSSAIIQGACQETVEAQGWWWSLNCPSHKNDVYAAHIHWDAASQNSYVLVSADSAALAIATALRDALRAEAGHE